MRTRDERGQSLVEFALILPIFVLLMVGIFDLGHVVWSNDALTNASREGARFAIVNGNQSQTPASRQDVKNAAINWAANAGTSVSATVCWSAPGAPCSGDTDTGTADRGQLVTVTVTANVSLAAPSFFGFRSTLLSSTTTMLVNH